MVGEGLVKSSFIMLLPVGRHVDWGERSLANASDGLKVTGSIF